MTDFVANISIKICKYLLLLQSMLIFVSIFITTSLIDANDYDITLISMQVMLSCITFEAGIHGIISKSRKRLQIYIICSLVLAAFLILLINLKQVPTILVSSSYLSEAHSRLYISVVIVNYVLFIVGIVTSVFFGVTIQLMKSEVNKQMITLSSTSKSMDD